MTLKPLIILTSCFVLNLSANPIYPAFRNDYTYIDSVKLFFKEHKLSQTWAHAVAKCSAEGTNLLVPKTADEVQAALLFKSNATTELWIGIHDLFSEGEFITLNGTYVSEEDEIWEQWQPDNAGNNQHCVAMGSAGLYKDESCQRRIKYICVKESSNIPTNAACETYDTEYVFKPEADRCYKVHNVPQNWTDAFKICKSEQSRMAIINSEAEANILVDMIEKYPIDTINGVFDKHNVFLGFNDIINKGNFLTIDGKTLKAAGYDTWGPNQPDNRYNQASCGAMYRDGKLNDLLCEIKAIFICEKVLRNPNVLQTHSRFGSVV